jgi:uncharacterized repeat protein (TIGR03837 family)
MLWDIFCRVIDNHGDLGVCWRLSAELASRGHPVRLWVDQADALEWMAPQAHSQVRVRPWQASLDANEPMSQVWLEGFGCELPEHFTQWAASKHETKQSQSLPVWLNLEYLSAETYVEKCHKLPSPVMSGPLKGRTKWFYYPGFTPQTGGLIREAHLRHLTQLKLNDLGPDQSATSLQLANPVRQTTLFCYEPAALSQALQLPSLSGPKHRWRIAHGRGSVAFDLALANLPHLASQIQFEKIPPISQAEFDTLLAQSELNFVRGEDSLVRALWAGKAFVWQIYPQDDGAHGPKLEAFLDWLEAPESLRQFHRVWNGLSSEKLQEIDLPGWQACTLKAQQRLLAQDDLVSQLLQFVSEKS